MCPCVRWDHGILTGRRGGAGRLAKKHIDEVQRAARVASPEVVWHGQAVVVAHKPWTPHRDCREWMFHEGICQVVHHTGDTLYQSMSHGGRRVST